MRRTVLALLFLGVVVVGIPAPPVSGASDPCVAESPNTAPTRGGQHLNGVSALASDDAWAVGNGVAGSPFRTMALHWDGGAWTPVPTPNIGTGDNVLMDVVTLTPDDAWAVGSGIKGGRKTLALHWDGVSWTVVPSPSPPYGSALDAVAAAGTDDIWAVGYTLRGGSTHRALIEHWNGTSWALVPGATVPGALEVHLLGVAALGPSDAWVVGYGNTGHGIVPVVQRWDGAVWRNVNLPSVGADHAILTSVATDGLGHAWAAGYAIDANRVRSLIVHDDGLAWTTSLLDDADPAFLRDIAIVGPADVWASGASYDAARHDYVPLVLHLDASGWSRIAAGSVRTPSELVGIVTGGTNGQLWTVGSQSTDAFIGLVCATPTFTTPVPSGPASITTIPVGTPDAAPIPVAQGTPVEVTASDRAVAAGMAETTKTYNATVGDVNADGWPDVLLGRHFRAARLYLSDADGTFTEANPGRFGIRDRHGCDFADVNLDLVLDLFCVEGGGRGLSFVKAHDLELQSATAMWTDATAAYGALGPFERGRHPAFIDANGDAYPDLFVGNERVRADGQPTESRLLLNDGGSRLVAAPEYGLDREIGANCAVAGDIDGDGWQDLLVCTDQGPVRLYANRDGTGFDDVSTAWHVPAIVRQGPVADAVLVDLDGDADLDLVRVTRTLLRIDLFDGDRFVAGTSRAVTGGNALASGDVNADGRPDLYVLQGGKNHANSADLMLLNDGTGVTFTEQTMPQTAVGCGDTVAPIDHDSNGLMDFVVLNGCAAAGPIQLIAFFPA